VGLDVIGERQSQASRSGLERGYSIAPVGPKKGRQPIIL